MKLLKLEILNLASLDRPEGETINFEEGALKESTIFSIVGPTGSGKSTILDAICLALYNRAPRYPRIKGARNQNIEIYGEPEEGEKNRLAPTDSRNILTRGRKQGYSKLTFLAGNGSVYRAEWYVNKKSKNFADAITSLYKISGTTEEAAEWDTLPQIIGLDYEQFLRTVLIAQGSFASFLTAKEEERYQLLEKLVGCGELYAGIAGRIRAKRDEAVQAYNEIAAGISAQQKDVIDDPKELEELMNRIAELEELDRKAKEELQNITKAVGWYTDEKTLQENVVKYAEALAMANTALEAAADKDRRLAIHDATLDAVILYKEIIGIETGITRLGQQKEALDADISGKQAQIQNEQEQKLAALVQAAAQAASTFEEQKPKINKARSIKVELEGLRTALTERKKTLEEALKAKTQADKDVQDNEKAIQAAGVDLQKAQQSKTALLESAESQRQSLREALEEVGRQIDVLNAGIKDVDISALNAEVETLLRTHTLMTSQQWEDHRSLLREGEACPLCGGTHHPYADMQQAERVASEVGELLGRKRKEQKDYNDTRAEIEKLLKKKDKADADIRAYEEALQQAVKQAETQESQAKIRLETEKGKTANLKAQQVEKTDALKTATDLVASAEAEVTTKTEALKTEIGDKDPDKYETELSQQKIAADKAVEDKKSAIGSLREQLGKVTGSLSTVVEAMKTEQEKLVDKNGKFSQWLSAYNAEHPDAQLTPEIIAALSAAPDNWEKTREELEGLRNALVGARKAAELGDEALAEHQQTKPEKTQEELQARKAELEAMSNEELVTGKARVQRHEEAKQQMGDMYVRKNEAEALKTEWEQIWDAVGTDGKTLRKIAQCYTLRFLIEHANVEIRKFNSRYELQQVKNSLGIRVIDHDRADDVRDTTTLSGGETFIVSLGLALGLSSLSSRNISFSNLFIDEGFGTLDPETLATVIDSLAMLQSSQGKKVGVISHTDTMSERIATQIRIIKNGNSGSSRIEIYP